MSAEKTISISDISYKVMNQVWPQCKDMTVFEYMKIREALLTHLTLELLNVKKINLTP